LQLMGRQLNSVINYTGDRLYVKTYRGWITCLAMQYTEFAMAFFTFKMSRCFMVRAHKWCYLRLNKSTAFLEPIFKNLKNAQQHYVEVSIPNFGQTGKKTNKVQVENMPRFSQHSRMCCKFYKELLYIIS
jgi:hypothetical protein